MLRAIVVLVAIIVMWIGVVASNNIFGGAWNSR